MEQEQTEEQASPVIAFDPMDPSIVDVFVNEAYIAMGNSEVSIVFGTQIPGADNKMRPRFRAFMSHATFVGLMSMWIKRSTFLADAYDGRPMSINDMSLEDADRIKDLVEKMVS